MSSRCYRLAQPLVVRLEIYGFLVPDASVMGAMQYQVGADVGSASAGLIVAYRLRSLTKPWNRRLCAPAFADSLGS